jgi:hypothetical protein
MKKKQIEGLLQKIALSGDKIEVESKKIKRVAETKPKVFLPHALPCDREGSRQNDALEAIIGLLEDASRTA